MITHGESALRLIAIDAGFWRVYGVLVLEIIIVVVFFPFLFPPATVVAVTRRSVYYERQI